MKPATRIGVKSLVGMYGKSGSGKTMSALLFARGLAGSSGKVGLIDSESGRGSIFADVIPGGYFVEDIEPPFSPENYQDKFEALEKECAVIVIDSLSHEHAGEGGVLDMHEAELTRMAGPDNWQKREACKMAAWIKPKFAHKKFLQRILRCKVPLICCLRGEEKTHIAKGGQGEKAKVITDEFSSPIFDPRFIFELLLNFETIAKNGQGGYVIPRKITHPDIAKLIPGPDEQIGVKHGEALAAWCNGTKVQPNGIATVRDLQRELWGIIPKEHTTGQKSWEKPEGWLLAKAIIGDGESVTKMTAEQLTDVITKAREA